MNTLEKERLSDFKKILTYHLVSKIRHSFKGNYSIYYNAPKIWCAWKNKKLKYNSGIYKMIIAFNQTGLSAHQVQSIFGKNQKNKWISYRELLKSDTDIKIFNKGTICMNGKRYQINQRYQLPIKHIETIFNDGKLLEKVLDAESDFYTDRQRRLIFTQINKQKKYHYKTKEELSDEEKIEALFEDIDF